MQEEKKNNIVELALYRLGRGRAVKQAPEPTPAKGVTVADVLAVFQGAKIVTDEPSQEEESLFVASQSFIPCPHCTKDAETNPKKEREVIETRYDKMGNRISRRVRTEEYSPKWRYGKIIERVWPDGRRELACHYCGRAVKNGENYVTRNEGRNT